MIKISALDFLEKKSFEVEVFSETGDLLYSPEDEVTPEVLLKLYFQNIFVKNEVAKETLLDSATKEYLPFDEKEAEEVAKYSILIGKKIGFNQERLDDLQKAAYYHKVGVKKLTKEDLSSPDFKEKRAEAGYKYILTQLKYSDEIAEVARLYNRPYNCVEFELNRKSFKEIPLYNIVAIADFYYNYMIKTKSKDATINKMLRLGNKKFNIYILHKFIEMVKNINE